MTAASWRRGILTWLLLLPFVFLPPWVASRSAPPNRYFVGASFYVDDHLQYLSFAEQASRGAFLLGNKFDPEAPAALLVNLEWWAVGHLARWLGGDLVLAFRLAGAGALLALCFGILRALEAAGLRGSRLFAGAALVLAGSGLGWLRLLGGASGVQVPDLLMGLYPSHQVLSNPHFLVGTALLLWTVLLHLEWRQGSRSRAPFVLTAWALGLSRPYDLAIFVLVVAVLAAVEAWRERRLAPIRPALDLAWLAPVFAYYGLLVGGSHSFGGWGRQSLDLSPPFYEFLIAMAPAAAVALAWTRPADLAGSHLRRTLAVWAGVICVLLLVWPDPMAKQCATSLGCAALLLAAAAAPTRWLLAALAAGLPTSALVLAAAAHPPPASYVPLDYRPALDLLRLECAPGDVALAPTDLSLLIAGHTPCQVVLGHRLLTPELGRRIADGRRFYDGGASSEWRRRFLEAERVRFVFLAPDKKPWLGEDAPFVLALRVPLFDVWRLAGPRSTMARDGNRGSRGALPEAEAPPH